MNDRAISDAVSTRYAGSAHESQKRAPTAANSTPVSSSISGYRIEISVSQLRQRPRSSSHETTGMLSRFAIFTSHFGQCDGGRTIDSWRGTRQMTTFKKEPITSPYKPLIAATSAVIAVEGTHRASHERSPGGLPAGGTRKRCTVRGSAEMLRLHVVFSLRAQTPVGASSAGHPTP